MGLFAIGSTPETACFSGNFSKSVNDNICSSACRVCYKLTNAPKPTLFQNVLARCERHRLFKVGAFGIEQAAPVFRLKQVIFDATDGINQNLRSFWRGSENGLVRADHSVNERVNVVVDDRLVEEPLPMPYRVFVRLADKVLDGKD